MSLRNTYSLGRLLSGSVAAALLGAVAVGPAFAAEPAKPAPAASDSAIPNFSAHAWRNNGGTQFNPIPGYKGPGPIEQRGEAYKHDAVPRVAETNNPILKPWAKKIMDDANAKVAVGGIPFVPTSRCWPGGVPGLLIYPAGVFYLQTPKVVYILNGRYEMRRIYMNVPHSKNPGYSWYGESVGHYENGDTLVIDTIGLDDKGPLDRYRTPHTKQLHVIERHKLVDGGKKMNVTFTVDDPGTFTTPWKAEVDFDTAKGEAAKWEEAICNENSTEYFIPEKDLVPVPHSDKRDF